jgi:hypothetical protein
MTSTREDGQQDMIQVKRASTTTASSTTAVATPTMYSAKTPHPHSCFKLKYHLSCLRPHNRNTLILHKVAPLGVRRSAISGLCYASKYFMLQTSRPTSQPTNHSTVHDTCPQPPPALDCHFCSCCIHFRSGQCLEAICAAMLHALALAGLDWVRRSRCAYLIGQVHTSTANHPCTSQSVSPIRLESAPVKRINGFAGFYHLIAIDCG